VNLYTSNKREQERKSERRSYRSSKELTGRKAKKINKGALEIQFLYNKKRWRIITSYSQKIEETLEAIMEEIREEEEEECIMIGGDFNAKTVKVR